MVANANAGLVRVPFHEDYLDAVQDPDGKVWVSLRRCCESLGVDFSKQLRKLKTKSWACVALRAMSDSDGKMSELAVVDLDTLPGWLFSIDARNINECLREKLARYQREAARVLADHFYGRNQPAPTAIDAETLRRVITDIVRELVPALQQPVHLPVPRYTIADRLKYKGWLTTSRRQRKDIYRAATHKLEMRHDDVPGMIGQVTVWHGPQIACLDDAIDEVRAEYAAREKAGMFANN